MFALTATNYFDDPIATQLFISIIIFLKIFFSGSLRLPVYLTTILCI